MMNSFLDALELKSELFLTFASLGLVAAIILEQAQLLAKYHGARINKVAGGYNAAMKVVVLNRVGAVTYVLFISISIDMGETSSSIASYFFIAILSLTIINFIITVVFRKVYNVKGALFSRGSIPYRVLIPAYIAPLFGLLGLTLPMLLSASNPELRLTMANTGVVFNSIFTLVNVFFVENHVAKMIDTKSNELDRFVMIVFMIRGLSALTAMITLLYISDMSLTIHM